MPEVYWMTKQACNADNPATWFREKLTVGEAIEEHRRIEQFRRIVENEKSAALAGS